MGTSSRLRRVATQVLVFCIVLARRTTTGYVAKVLVIAFNTYREAVRARILHGLFAVAIATALYALVVGEYTARNALRVVSDIGSFGVSSYGIVVAIVMGATGLYRELELKTVFPILARPLSRGQYLLGKYLGTLLTLLVFMLANSAVLLLALHFMAGGGVAVSIALVTGSLLVAWGVSAKFTAARTYVPIVWTLSMVCVGWALAREAPDDRRVVLCAAALALLEVAIITALATLFSSFSSPFLTAVFTFGAFVVGRSADTLARLPPKVFGEAVTALGASLSKVVPNLMVYVPPRAVLTGEASEVAFAEYFVWALAQAAAWSTLLLLIAAFIFRKRDFV